MHTAFRTRSPQALARRVAALKDTPHHIGWIDGDIGHGPAYRCHDPDGHVIELYYETEWFAPPAELKPALKNQAQRYPALGIRCAGLIISISSRSTFPARAASTWTSWGCA